MSEERRVYRIGGPLGNRIIWATGLESVVFGDRSKTPKDGDLLLARLPDDKVHCFRLSAVTTMELYCSRPAADGTIECFPACPFTAAAEDIGTDQDPVVHRLLAEAVQEDEDVPL